MFVVDDIAQHIFAAVNSSNLSQLYRWARKSMERIVPKNAHSGCNSFCYLWDCTVSNRSNKHVAFPLSTCTHTNWHMFAWTWICNKLHVKPLLSGEDREFHRKKFSNIFSNIFSQFFSTMPTGPFAALGKWPIFQDDGSMPRTGPASHLTIVKATRKYIKYTRKCKHLDPNGEDVRHGKVYRWDIHTFRVSVGGFQYITATDKK